MQNVYEYIKKTIKNKFGKNVELNSVLTEIGIDSLDVLDLIVETEEKFNIKIEDNELLKLKTIEDIVNLINDKI